MNRSGGVGKFTMRVLRRPHPQTAKRFYRRCLDAEDLGLPLAASSKFLDKLNRLLHGGLSLGSGPRFLQPLNTHGDVLNFSSGDRDEFRREMGKQLQDLRRSLKKPQRRPPTPIDSEKAPPSRTSRRSESDESGKSQESERRPKARQSAGRSDSNKSEKSEESERRPRSKQLDSKKSLQAVRGESEQSERYPYGDSEPKRFDRRSDRAIRSESEESEELEVSERRPMAGNNQITESEKTAGSKKSSRAVRAESKKSEESEVSEESASQPRARDPNLIQGTYWTGEGKRLEVRVPSEEEKSDNSGYISGDGKEAEGVPESERKPSDAPRGQDT